MRQVLVQYMEIQGYKYLVRQKIVLFDFLVPEKTLEKAKHFHDLG